MKLEDEEHEESRKKARKILKMNKTRNRTPKLTEKTKKHKRIQSVVFLILYMDQRILGTYHLLLNMCNQNLNQSLIP